MSEPLFPRLTTPDDAEAVRVGESSLTYRELASAAGRLVGRLEGAERVAIWATPSLETCVGVVGALAAGACVVPINPKAGQRELEHLVADSAPARLLLPPGQEPPPALASIDRVRISVEGAGNGRLPDLLPHRADALILYTSGTTGLPKGAQLSRRAIESNLDGLAKVWEWTADDSLVHALPLFHVHGLVLGVLGPLRRGCPVELIPRFSPAGLGEAVGRGATIVFAVPTMYHRIGIEAELDARLARAFSSARLLVSGSAALPATEHERIRRLTGQAIVERYGMTETIINLAVAAADDPRPGYVGRPVPGVEIRLVDDEGAVLDVADDATFGEIAVRGPNVFSGYLNRPEATAETTRDGWFFTGDLATVTPDGVYRIVGRLATDLIKSGGYRIGAGEIEGALLEHPAIAEAAVAGIPDDDLGERIGAWIVLAPSASVTREELRRHVGSLLSSHKRPHAISFVDELPRNTLGKVTKGLLPAQP